MLVAESVGAGLTPVPVRVKPCGERSPLSTIVTAADFAPRAVGEKVPLMVQFAPAARLDPHVLLKLNEDAFAPVTLMLLMAIATAPVLDSVTLCDPLVVPMVWFPKTALGADRVTVVTPVPRPVS